MFAAGKKIRLVSNAVYGHRDIGEVFVAAEPTAHVKRMISDGYKLQSYISRDGSTTHSPLEYWESAEPESPIREITKREIVPGIYGLVEIANETGNGFVRIRLGREVFNADELDAAASVLTQIAAVMRENSNG